MSSKGKYVSNKIRLLKEEKPEMNLKQAIAIALNMYNKRNAAMGGSFKPIKRYQGGGTKSEQKPLISTEALDNYIDYYRPKEKGYTPEFYFSEFRDAVGYHEGDLYGGYSAIQAAREDGSRGPGRGRYQFDYKTAKTANQRMKNLAAQLGYSYPEISDDMLKNMHTAPEEIQDLLFTAHFLKDDDSRVQAVSTDKSQWADQWAIGHWKGSDADKPIRMESFNTHLSQIDPDEGINPAFLSIFPDTYPGVVNKDPYLESK